jgi:hypothetical protein
MEKVGVWVRLKKTCPEDGSPQQQGQGSIPPQAECLSLMDDNH